MSHATVASLARLAFPWLAIATTVIVGGLWLSPRQSATSKAPPARDAAVALVASSVPAAPAPTLSAGSTEALDLETALARATSSALQWHRDAELVEITVNPVDEGRLDPAAGTVIQMRFGTPAGRRLGPGAPVSADQLLVRIDGGGHHVERVRGPAARVVAPPACDFDRAWRAIVASGVPSRSSVALRFAMSKNTGRAVWTAQPEGSRQPTRTLDGSSCAIIVRR